MDERRKVMLISNHPLFREGLTRVITRTEAYRVEWEAASVEEAVTAAEETPPDVIIYDRSSGLAGEGELAALLRMAPSELVAISLSDPEMTVFSRRQVGRATVDDLLEVIEGIDPQRRTE